MRWIQLSSIAEIVVLGGGHAGIEAALACARMGHDTMLITTDPLAIGRMSCNPAIGGTAKGHLVREVDAIGGEMGKLADATGIHFRMLNKSKGPAIWSPRCQNDRDWYGREATAKVLSQERLRVIAGSISDIETSGGVLTGCHTESGMTINCRALVICAGTFLNATMFTGLNSSEGGRFGEGSSKRLSGRLSALGFKTGRLKTGTPPRLDRRTIDFSATEEQLPDTDPRPFSFANRRIVNRQVPMYLTYTSSRTHDELRGGFSDSPMFSGRIVGVGPRYCPSIEDKISRFSGRDRHQLFLEPEGYESEVVYVNGFSTSLPADVQQRAIRTIPGLENARILRPGYAVEYDFFPPYQLEHSLESKLLRGLFFAGQVNGTSGYEEAAGQGLVAGINAALYVRGEDPLLLERSEAYIGVMVDDLINKGTEEPYRIFTSRAEYRLLLRQDNADSRLMKKGHSLGLVKGDAIKRLAEKEALVELGRRVLTACRVPPAFVNGYLEGIGLSPASETESVAQLAKRPGVSLRDLLSISGIGSDGEIRVLLDHDDALERLEIDLKYEGYLRRQEEDVRRLSALEHRPIPEDFDFSGLPALSSEGREKLTLVKPRTIGQASRISGLTPADVSVLMIHLQR